MPLFGCTACWVDQNPETQAVESLLTIQDFTWRRKHCGSHANFPSFLISRTAQENLCGESYHGRVCWIVHPSVFCTRPSLFLNNGAAIGHWNSTITSEWPVIRRTRHSLDRSRIIHGWSAIRKESAQQSAQIDIDNNKSPCVDHDSAGTIQDAGTLTGHRRLFRARSRLGEVCVCERPVRPISSMPFLDSFRVADNPGITRTSGY